MTGPQRILVAEIVLGERVRPIDPNWVAGLAEEIKASGAQQPHLKDMIEVRPVKRKTACRTPITSGEPAGAAFPPAPGKPPGRGKLKHPLKTKLKAGHTAEVIVTFAEENPLKGSEQGGFGRHRGREP